MMMTSIFYPPKFIISKQASNIRRNEEEMRTSDVFAGKLQGITKIFWQGLVNRWKNYVLLPVAGRKMEFFHLIFTEPGRSLLVLPCITVKYCISRMGNIRGFPLWFSPDPTCRIALSPWIH